MDKNKKKYAIIGGIFIAVIAFGAIAISKARANQSSSSKPLVMSAETSKAKATAHVDKGFQFQAINQAKSYKEINYTITTVERKDEIKVKGEARHAPKDLDYLLVRIEIENTHPERLAINPSDMLRLEDGRGKLFSPDYHNGNIILDPISVKNDLMSFLVRKDAKNFTFQIGELEGEKEKVEVNF